METHSLFAEWDGDTLEGARLDAGHVHRQGRARRASSKLPKDKVDRRDGVHGGGFGSKFGAGDYGVFAAKLAKKAGKPVQHGPRPQGRAARRRQPARLVEPRQARLQEGRDRDGRPTTTSFGTAGVATGTGTGGFVKNAYGFPNVKVAESDVFTHLGPGCAMRAPGPPAGLLRRRDGSRRGRRAPRPGPARRAPQERSFRGPARGVGNRREGDRLVAPRRDHEGERSRRGGGGPSAPARPRLRRRRLVQHRRAGLAGPRPHPPRRQPSRSRTASRRSAAASGRRSRSWSPRSWASPSKPSASRSATRATRSGPPPAARRRRARSSPPSAPPAFHAREKLAEVAAHAPRRAQPTTSRSRTARFSAKGKTADFGEGLLADERRVARRDRRPRAGLRRRRHAPLRRAVRRGRRRRRDRRRDGEEGRRRRTTAASPSGRRASRARSGAASCRASATRSSRSASSTDRSGRFLNPNVEHYKILGEQGHARDRPDRPRPLSPARTTRTRAASASPPRSRRPRRSRTRSRTRLGIRHRRTLPITPARILAALGNAPRRKAAGAEVKS